MPGSRNEERSDRGKSASCRSLADTCCPVRPKVHRPMRRGCRHSSVHMQRAKVPGYLSLVADISRQGNALRLLSPDSPLRWQPGPERHQQRGSRHERRFASMLPHARRAGPAVTCCRNETEDRTDGDQQKVQPLWVGRRNGAPGWNICVGEEARERFRKMRVRL